MRGKRNHFTISKTILRKLEKGGEEKGGRPFHHAATRHRSVGREKEGVR